MDRTPPERQGRWRDQGFSLVEVLVVVVMVGILAAIVVPSFQGLLQGVQEASTRSDLAAGRTAIAAWQLDNNGLLPKQSGFDPGASGSNLTAYGWTQSTDSVAFAYSTNIPVKATSFCLQMTSTDGAIYSVSTNNAVQPKRCSALGGY